MSEQRNSPINKITFEPSSIKNDTNFQKLAQFFHEATLKTRNLKMAGAWDGRDVLSVGYGYLDKTEMFWLAKNYKGYWNMKFGSYSMVKNGSDYLQFEWTLKGSPLFWNRGPPSRRLAKLGFRLDSHDSSTQVLNSLFYSQNSYEEASRIRTGIRSSYSNLFQKFYIFFERRKGKNEENVELIQSDRLRFKFKRFFWLNNESIFSDLPHQFSLVHDIFPFSGKTDWHAKLNWSYTIKRPKAFPSVSAKIETFNTMSISGKSQFSQSITSDWSLLTLPHKAEFTLENIINGFVSSSSSLQIPFLPLACTPQAHISAAFRNLNLRHLSYGLGFNFDLILSSEGGNYFSFDVFYDLQAQKVGFKLWNSQKFHYS
jgi:hypothetical protein